jgi:beta-glucanase (GH16 family)
MDFVMHDTRRKSRRAVGGKHWLAGGVMVAGLGAAVITGTATATADTGDSGTSAGTSATASSGADTTQTDGPSSSADGDVKKRGSAAAESTESSGAEDPDVADPAEAGTDADSDADDADTETAEADADDVDTPAEDPGDEDSETAPAVVAKDREEDTSSTLHHTTGATTVGADPAPESVTVAPTVRTTVATVAVPSDPVLVAAATSTKVTIGSMIVDWLYSIGIRSSKMGTNFLDISVSTSTAERWLIRRAKIYKDVVLPPPENPTIPGAATPLWETNFSSMEEALKYWGLQTGRWGQSAGENQYYTDGDNIYIDAAGNLVIEARREAAPDGLGAPNNYTSARVVTMGKQSFGVGQRIVARIQMPVTKGVLPAFWSVGLEPGHEYDWPRQGEIDIAEIPTLGTPASAATWTGNIHGPSAADNTVDVKLHDIDANLGVDLSQGFHDYGIDWHADRIVWHVDGVQVGQVTRAQYEALGGNWTPFSGAWDHYLILNVAVGNPWNGDPDPSAPFQAQMKVDWVKAYAL